MKGATMLDGRQCLARLGEPQAFAGCPPHWDAAMAAWPERGLPFLDRATLAARREAAGLAADCEERLHQVIGRLEDDPALAQLAWYLYWGVFLAPEIGLLWGAPELTARLGALSGAFYQLLILDLPVHLAACHRRRGYPPEVTADTLRQVKVFDDNYRRGCGCPGAYPQQFPWLATYFRDPYVRLGRLEFQLHPYGGGVCGWRRSGDGAVLALAEGGVRVDAAGLQATADAGAWETAYAEEDGYVIGHPIDPAGFIRRETVRLPRGSWAPFLRRGDTVLDLHIPPGGRMTPEACRDSFTRACDFFERHHTDRPFSALVVSTWFMDPQLAALLPADANPLCLQRAGYLYPTPPNPGGLWFVFLQSTEQPAALPHDTSLRRALAAFLEQGGQWHGGGMFLPRDAMAQPVDGRYRSRFPSLCREIGVASHS